MVLSQKYVNTHVVVPEDQKMDINNKIVYLIEQNLLSEHDVTAEDVYNTFSSIGGLHGLNFNDFNSYHEFSEEKKKFEMGQFFTPHEICEFVVKTLNIKPADVVADLTCGSGSFFNFLPNENNVYGVEVDKAAHTVAQFLYPEATIIHEDIRSYETKMKADFMLLNPPFNLKFRGQSSQSYVIQKAYDGLKYGGVMAVIVPESYLRDEFTSSSEIAEMNQMFTFLGQYSLGADAFKEKSANISTKIMYFAKRSDVLPHTEYSTDTVVLDDFSDGAVELVQERLLDFYRVRDSKKLEVHQQEVAGLETSNTFVYRVNKMLYNIEVNPKTKHNLKESQEYYSKFLTQKKPEEMPVEQWDRVKVTEKKVLKKLKLMLNEQNVVERDEIRLVKTQYGLKYKGYSKKTRAEVSRRKENTVVPFRDLFEENSLGYGSLVDRKAAWVRNQMTPYSQVTVDDFAQQKEFVENLVLRRADGSEVVLNDVQQEDTIKMLSKDHGYLQWDTGSGKTMSAMAQMLYRQKFNHVRNIYVVSNAIAVNNNLEETFQDFGFDVIRVRTYSDVQAIQPGQVVLMTFDALNKHRKHVQRHVKLNARKVMLVLDEADNICNVKSLRYKSVLACFRRAKYKLLMSGTSTRNNVAESFTAFELLYNNGDAFLNNSAFLYQEPKKKEEFADTVDGFIRKVNERRGLPFSAYSKGFLEFRRSFSPAKSSVFGVQKTNQGIYNKDVLAELISYTMITRSFEEVSHKDLYAIDQHVVSFSTEERELYEELMNDFHKFYGLYKSTGNSRKDSMLRIIQQLNSLLRAPVQPGKYASGVESSKYPALKQMVSDAADEWVAVGATNVGVVHEYVEMLKADFPDRPIFVITGNDATLNQRKRIVKELKASGNGLLVCTQQSLSSSMNIDFVNKVILLQLQWNFPVMKQFFSRFVRFTSLYPKTITFLLNGDSIETNLLKLLLAKERMNLFMKDSDVSDDELNEYFGIDDGFFEQLLSKETDEYGKSYIAWGTQEVHV